jgi:hypothetical protein
MTQFTEKDFARLPFNPMGKKRLSGTQLKEILKPISDEKEERQEELLRWVIAMYDQASPISRAYPDLKQRKICAAAVAGITDEATIDALIDNTIEGIPEMVNNYLRLYGHNRLWAMIVAQEAQFWEYQYRLLKPVDGSKDKEILQSIELKSKIASELDITSTRLDGYYQKLYSNDDDMASISRVKRLTPETIADVLSR